MSSEGPISDFEARLALARLLSYRSDQLDKSVHEYRILLKERPNDPLLGTELASLLIRQKKYPEALQLLQIVLKKKPHDPAALTALARIYLWSGKNEDALRTFGRLSKRSLPPDVQMDIARAYARNKEYAEAGEIYENLLKTTRAAHRDIYAELGDVQLYAGQTQQAIGNYRKALKIDPSFHAAQRQLALALSWSGQTEEALPLLIRLNQENSSDREITVSLARVYAASQKTTEAASLVRNLISLYPEDAALMAELADIEAVEGHAARCRELYLKALSISENNEEILLRYAAQMNMWGDFHKVESIYRDYIAVHPWDLDVNIKLAWLLVSAQRYEEAEGHYLQLLQHNPGQDKVLLDLARLKLIEKDFTKSITYAERFLSSTSPLHPDGLFVKGEALFQSLRYDEALSVYVLLAEVEPQQARGALGAGKSCLKRGRPEEALAFFSKARQIDPHNVEARFWSTGPERARSSDFLSDLLKSGKESPPILVQWAQMYASQGYNQMAISCYEEASRQDVDNFPARMGLAEILAADNQYDRSGDILKELAAEFPGASKILITRGRVLAWSRHYDQSMEVYEQVRRSNPSDPVSRKEKARTAAWGKKMDLAIKVYEEAYRVPVDSTLTSSIAKAVREANDPQLTRLFEKLRKSSESGSVFQGYEAFYEELDRISGQLSPNTLAELEEVRLDLLPACKIQKAAYLEGRSKWLAWNRKFTRAIDSYKELIRFQPGNEEALFDYAQAECSLGLCDREPATYGNLLAIDPLHSLAAMGLERQQIRNSPSLEIDHSYWDEEGRDGLSQIMRNRTDLRFDFPISCRYHLGIAAHHWLEDPKMRGITYDAYGHTMQFGGVLNEYVSGAVSWTNKQYVQNDVSSTNTGFSHLWFNLRDYARLGVGYERTDELYNNFGVKQGLQADSFWVGASSYLTRNFEVKGKAQYMRYSDENTGQIYFLSTGYDFTEHPRVIKLSLTGEYRDTDKKSLLLFRGSDLVDIIHPYWTPQNYFGTAATLEWRHDLSKYFFCGSEQHYYSLRVGGGTDTEDNPSLRLEGEWHYEFKNHWTVAVKALLHDSSQWDATGAWVTVKYQF